MNFMSNYFLVLSSGSDNYEEMKYGKLVFWVFTAVIVAQAIAPINSANGRLNHTFIFYVRLDYLAHIAMFSCLSVLYRVAYFPHKVFIFRNELLYLGVMLFLAFFSEAIQLLVSYRAFNIYDLVANFLGVVFSIPLTLVYRFFLNRRQKYLQSRLNEPVI